MESMLSKTKTNMGRGIILIRMIVLKVINNKIKVLTHLEIIDHMGQGIESVITQMSKESNMRIHLNLRRPNFSYYFSFKFHYFCIVDIWTAIRNFVKENKKSFRTIKTT